MYSTPIEPSYYDDPLGNMKYLETLAPWETKIYTQGYIQAMHHVLEALIDTKTHLLEACLTSDDAAKTRLLLHVKLLDMLDAKVRERVLLLNAMG